MNKHNTSALLVLSIAVASVFVLGGCDFLKTDSSRWLAPEKVIKARGKDLMLVRSIRPSISPADQETELVPNATFPTPEDLRYSDAEYVIGPSDTVEVSILDLFSEGLETTLRRTVTEGGYIDLPLLSNRIKADGLTKEGLTEVLKREYSRDILVRPTISVTVLYQRQNTFSILGAVDRPSQYSIFRRDMRLWSAIALAGGITQSNIRYIYVVRQSPPVLEKSAPAEGTMAPLPKEVSLEATEKPEDSDGVNDDAMDLELRKLLGGEDESTSTDDKSAPAVQPGSTAVPHFAEISDAAGAPIIASTTADAEVGAKEEEFDLVWANGKWVKVAKGSEPVEPSTTPSTTGNVDSQDPFQWGKAGAAGLARVIAIDLNQLRSGDPKMNIVIRDKDVIHIPSLEIGEFYVMGEVSRPGVYSLTGRQITIKQAIAAAGNLGPLAWPENSMLIRRVGPAEEQMIPLNIEKIFGGTERDIFLKPNDIIAVGTDIRASFFAVVRNAFRMTYGFGFIYDRNFANPSFTTGRQDSSRFTRW